MYRAYTMKEIDFTGEPEEFAKYIKEPTMGYFDEEFNYIINKKTLCK